MDAEANEKTVHVVKPRRPSPAPGIVLLLLGTLFVVFMYTFLHEGGHALVGIASGSTITAFSVSFLDLSAHVAMTGDLTPAQTIATNLAGVSMPLLVWLVFMLAAPRRGNLAVEDVKVVGSLVVLSSLLAWTVLPLLFWSGRAPGSDDVINFLNNSAIHPLWVGTAALLVYLAGWRLFVARIDGLRREIDLFRQPGGDTTTPAVRKTVFGVAGVWALCGLVAFGANGYRFDAPRADPFLPPPGYTLAKTVDLSRGGYEQAAMLTFTLDKPAVVGIFLLVEDVDSDYLEVRLTGPARYDRLIVHAEGYTARRDSPRLEDSLQPGQYELILTSRPSPGRVSIYVKGTP
jgi:hypothetical protein